MATKGIRAAAIAVTLWCALGQSALAADGGVFAKVDGRVITLREYQAALANGLRQKYYHGRPPEEEISRFGREVGEDLVTQVLLGAEAERRGIEPDRAAVGRAIEDYERRYAQSESWKASRDVIVPRLTGELERRSRLERLEAQVRDVPRPTEAEAREFHAARPQLFTEPERLRFSLILLPVDPTARGEAVDAIVAGAEALRREIAAGADFAELARRHSKDPSAKDGGDLGYVHRGMLPEPIERQFADGLAIGQVSAPTRLLEGVAIVRLDDRKAPRLRPFGEVAASATDLLQRERGEQAWAALKAQLRAASNVWFDESVLAAVSAR